MALFVFIIIIAAFYLGGGLGYQLGVYGPNMKWDVDTFVEGLTWPRLALDPRPEPKVEDEEEE